MNFYTTILGSGAAVPTLIRHCSAQVVNVNGFRLLLDCGEGTQNQVRAFHQKMQSISLICISHLHGDHFFGLPGLLSTMHLCGRTEPVDIVAPKGLKEILDRMFEYSNSEPDFEIRIHELEGETTEMVFENKRCRVTAFPLLHSVPTWGYSIDEVPRGNNPQRRYVYCSDTAYTESILPMIEGANLLCLECTFADDFASVADAKLHLTASRAAMLAQKGHVGQLLLTHFSARYKTVDPMLQQASSLFPNTLAANDGEIFQVNYFQEPIQIKPDELKAE